MTVKEYLIESGTTYNDGIAIELRDILNDGNVYCGGGYNQLMEEISTTGLSHVANARFVSRNINNENSCIILCYIKDIELYSQSVLEQVAKKIVLE